MFKHPMTDIGIERFLKDWEKYKTGRWGFCTELILVGN
jgi:hypothetical protein